MRTYDTPESAREAVAPHPAKPAMALIHDAPDARLVVFRIAPGQVVPVHTSMSAVVLYVVSGAGIVAGAEGERSVRPGTVVVYEPNEPHGMRAVGEELNILALIAPRPGDR